MIKAWSLYFDVCLVLFIAVQTSNLFPHLSTCTWWYTDAPTPFSKLFSFLPKLWKPGAKVHHEVTTSTKQSSLGSLEVHLKFTRSRLNAIRSPVISARNKCLLSKGLPETLSGWSFRNFLAELRQGYMQHKYVICLYLHATSFYIILHHSTSFYILNGTDGLSPLTLTGLQFFDS